MAGKRRRSRPMAASEPAAKEPAAEDLSNRYAKLFGGDGNGSGLSSFLAGGAASGPATSSSSSAAPPAAASTPVRTPAKPLATVAATPAQKSSAASSSGAKPPRKKGDDGARGRKGVEAPEEPPEKKRRLTEEELHEREGRTLFVGNVPLAWEKQELRRALRTAVGDKYSGQFRPIWFRAEPLEEKWQGNLRKVGSIMKAHAKGVADAKNAYVVLASPEDVTTVRHAVHGYAADPRHMLRADGVGEAAKLQTFDRKRSVFVGNLPASTSEADLRTVFAPIGQVDAVRVVRDRIAKACKGFAFVRFKDRSSVKAAINLWGVELQGRPIRVMKVTQPEGDDSTGAPAGHHGQASQHPAAKRLAKKAAPSWKWGGSSSGAARAGGAVDAKSKKMGKKAKKKWYKTASVA